MTETVLTTQQLNRTLLHRQHLLERSSMSAGDMLCAIVGLQAQEVKDPYLALWSRINGFRHKELASMLTNRDAVRASLMRGTIHLVTRDDYAMLFPATYSLHARAVKSITAAKLVPPEHHAEISQQAYALLRNKPQTTAELGATLAENWPDYDPKSLGTIVRFLLPLLQSTPRGVWGPEMSARPVWSLPETWLGTEILTGAGPAHEMIRRYLRAFGPASLPDITAWSGVTNLKSTLVELGDELISYRNAAGTLLYDLAEAEIVDGDAPAPVRFLPGFDNALLGYKDRRRIIDDEARAMISTPNGMFASTFLVDGFVAGMWRVRETMLELHAYRQLTPTQQRDVVAEAEEVAPFWTGDALQATWVEPWKSPGKHGF